MNLEFYYENGKLCATVFDFEKKQKYNATDDQINTFLERFGQFKAKLKIPKIYGDSLVCMLDNYGITLKNYKDFVKDVRFSPIFDKYKNSRLKINKSGLVKGGAIVLAAAAVASLLYCIITKDDTRKIGLENEIIYKSAAEDNSTLNANYVENNIVVLDSNENNNDDIRKMLNIPTNNEEEKARYTRDNYYNTIEYYSKMYDINPEIMCAIAIQERGVHSEATDSDGAIGLMQIQVSVWDNETINVYNNYTNSWESLYITEDKLGDLNFNVQSGCAIFRSYLDQMNGNILAAILAYNRGIYAAKEIISTYASYCGITYEDVINNPNDLGWLKYEGLDYAGDKQYIEHVMRYYEGNYSDIGIDSKCKM